MFCIGCARRLPGFVATGPSMLETARGRVPRQPAIEALVTDHAAGGLRHDDPRKLWLWLGAGALALIGAFMAWFFLIARPATGSSERATPAAGIPASPPASSPALASPSAAPRLDDRPVATPPAPTSPPTPSIATSPTPAPANASAPSPQGATPSALPARAPTGEAAARTVEKFYIALSVGDGSAAAALITPAKRGVGPFSEAGMTRFYRSLRDPLALRSVRPLGAGRVEARYRYRATKNTCEATAIVQTEVIGDKTLIRSIRANC
ncbi:hypothetical protein [Variovorax rhizosphaerae]|uniref:Serine/threonine protein kinase n=1 Tax=Variovorax rhizosphaerae TaxID=1836200 RepID=A0ABU8WM47_9BURK